MKRVCYTALRITTLLALILLSLPIVLQDFLIFPELVANPFGSVPKPPHSLIETFFVDTEDQERLAVWRLAAANKNPRGNAIFFHGNGGNLRNFVYMQERLSQAGFNAYSFDYRGYGESSGWPSEAGLYLDASAVWQAVQSRERAAPSQILLVGYSLGTGVAAELATRVEPGAVLLFSPYSSMSDVVGENPDFKYYAPFLFYSFPTLENLKRLPGTCVLIAHGKRDSVISFVNSQRIFAALSGRKNFKMVDDAEADHVNIFERQLASLLEQLPSCGFRY